MDSGPIKAQQMLFFCMKVLLGFKFEFENAVWNLKSTVLLWIWRKSRTTKRQSDEQWSRENRCIIPVLLLICLKNMYKIHSSRLSAFVLGLEAERDLLTLGKSEHLTTFAGDVGLVSCTPLEFQRTDVSLTKHWQKTSWSWTLQSRKLAVYRIP